MPRYGEVHRVLARKRRKAWSHLLRMYVFYYVCTLLLRVYIIINIILHLNVQNIYVHMYVCKLNIPTFGRVKIPIFKFREPRQNTVPGTWGSTSRKSMRQKITRLCL